MTPWAKLDRQDNPPLKEVLLRLPSAKKASSGRAARAVARPHSVTISVLLILAAAAVILIGGFLREVHSARSNAADAVRNSAVLIGERIARDGAPLTLTDERRRSQIDSLMTDFAPRRGAVFLLSGEGGPVLRAGRTDAPNYRPDWLSGAVPHGHRLALRRLPGGGALLVIARGTPTVASVLPYALIALLLAGGALLVLRQMQEFAEEAETLRDDRDRLSKQEQAMGEAGIGTWTVRSGSLQLPSTLRHELGFARKDILLPLGEIGAVIDKLDAPRAAAFFSGKLSRDDGRFLMIDASGARRSVYFNILSQDDLAWGAVLSISDEALDDGRSLQLNQRLHETLEAIPEAFLHWDAFGRLVAWNDQFRVIFNVSSDGLRQGMTIDEVSTQINIEQHYLRSYFAPPAASKAEEEAAFPDGRTLRIIRRRTIGDGWVCIGHDITDAKMESETRARNERELEMTVTYLENSRAQLEEANRKVDRQRQKAEEASHRAVEANRAKSEFLANISHELRTPLNAIIGFSSMMKAELYGPLGDRRYSEYARDIKDSGTHLLALIDDILDLSKVEAGKMELRLTPFDLDKLLEETIRVAETQIRQDQVDLLAAHDHLPNGYGDARAVKQVLLNLLTNAAKFTKPGGKITVTAVADLDCVTLVVADTGCGIRSEDLKRLGTPFLSLTSSQERDQRGTGLGLALSKSLMEAMGGILSMASEQGRGTVAAVTIPRRPSVVAQLPDFLNGNVHVLTKKSDGAPGHANISAVH